MLTPMRRPRSRDHMPEAITTLSAMIVPSRGLDANRLALLDQDARDLGILEDLGTARAGAGGQRLRHVDRIDLAVLGQEHAARHAFHVVDAARVP